MFSSQDVIIQAQQVVHTSLVETPEPDVVHVATVVSHNSLLTHCYGYVSLSTSHVVHQNW